ncbi:hypothetical protein DXG03_005842 [Asterophora parasitica]|uniref:Uncharacterized protein n=1 Tax=Asterophora parasitica TaxID=117018 RepID=A0A9P7G1K4_9AGAR|nr:hypothetical protein DXG03_005842 [Asterophora parasitica]
MALGPLDYDTQSIVFSLADTPTLLALSRTSKSHAAQARPLILRDVSLSRDPAQVVNFQRFVAANGLGHHIRKLFIRRGAFHPNPPICAPRYTYDDADPSEPEVVARAVAEVLAEAHHLRVLCIDKFAQDLLTMEPRLGKVLTSCMYLTDLTLWDVVIDSLKSLNGLRGLRQLTLVIACRSMVDLIIWPNYLHVSKNSSVATLILNSSSTLESLTLRGFHLESFLNDPTISFPKVQNLSYLDCTATLKDQERAFPAVRSVHFDPTPFPKTTVLSAFSPFWLDLESIHAYASFMRIFHNVRTLRRLGLRDHLHPGPEWPDAQLLLNQLGSNNHLVSLSLQISDPASIVLQAILKETPKLVFLEVTLRSYEPAHVAIVREMLVNPVPPSPLASASSIKYLSIALAPSVTSWISFGPDNPSPATRDVFVHNWMKALPHLRYMDISLENDVNFWDRRVWHSSSIQDSLQLLSQADGDSIRSWYDSEWWRCRS